MNKIQEVNYNNLDRWAIGRELFKWIRENLEEGSTILEFGSGTGTGELAKFYNMISVEQNEQWVDYIKSDNVTYIHAPLKDEWYDAEKVFDGVQDRKYDLIIIDGPQGDMFRGGIDKYMDKLNTNVPILLDDTNRIKDKDHAIRLAEQLNKSYIEIKGSAKNFIVILPKDI